MRFTSPAFASVLLVALSCGAHAGQEPFGPEVEGWRFTQAFEKSRIVCRAFALGGPVNIIGRLGNGEFYVSVPSTVPKGKYDESTIEIGKETEMVNARSDGDRYVMPVDEDQVGRIVKARGYGWYTEVKRRPAQGSVAFNDKVATAITRLRECTKANGGR